VAADFTRIFSDIHYGDRASRVHSLAQLRPLLEGPAALILNGDTLETRPGSDARFAADMLAEVTDFFPRHVAGVTYITGNHDADLTSHHALDLAGGEIFVTHGDIIFDDIVPWSRDAPLIRERLAAEFAGLTPTQRADLPTRLAAFRRVAISIPQRHHSERNPLKYAFHFVNDALWPPNKVLQIFDAWQTMPGRAAALLRQHRPEAKFISIGHTHRPGVWRQPDGVVVINTGSFCRPFGGCVVDLAPGRLVVRRIVSRGGEFHAGPALAEFALAAA